MPALLLMVAAAFAPLLDAPEPADQIAVADAHRQSGRYAEALEAYAALEDQPLDPAQRAPLVIARSRVLEETGDWRAATDSVRAAVAAHPAAALWTRLAELEYRQGNYSQARGAADQSLRLDENDAGAHVIRGHVLREAGRFDEAVEEYRWCVRYYNRVQPSDAATLLAVAEGSLEYARWKRVTNIFGFVVNTLCPDALKSDARCWQAYALSGGLLLEKYNQGQAEIELNRALAVNPRAARVLVLLGTAALRSLDVERAEQLADQALDVNPRLPEALLLKADLRLVEGNAAAARPFVEQALAVNPADQRIRAREAVCCLLEDGVPPDDELLSLFLHLDAIELFDWPNRSRFTEILSDVARANPRPGDFLSIVAEALDARRQYAAAEMFYRQAILVMPQLAAPRANLGMLYMRTGRIDEAGRILDEAFQSDPFHVRVSNMRKVLGVLNGYDTISTDHFVLRCDRSNHLLATAMGRYLEGLYAELTERYRFEPPERTPFEIYSAAQGQGAHEWFSARMVGLPWIQTIGASTGMIVALASPTDRQPYHWARVLRHEFVHILTLQKTGFNIPHWFTEALAVREEGGAIPEGWQRLLLQRVPQGDVFNLSTLNAGFQRPRDGDDWEMAYCQSALYAEYLVERFGDDALLKLLEAFCTARTTEAALKLSLQADLADVEAGYRQFLQRTVDELRSRRAPAWPDVATARAAHEADESDPAAAGRYALALLGDKRYQTARDVARRAYDQQASQPDAAYVLARVALARQNDRAAVNYLQAALDESQPHAEVLALLARLRLDAGETNEAARLYRLGTEHFPLEDRYWHGLLLALWKTDESATLRPVLETVAERDFNNVAVRKRLAQIAHAEGNIADAIHWANEALLIDIEDVEVHRLLAECYEQAGRPDAAAEEFQAVLTLAPDDAQARERLDALRREPETGS